jgi:hypothetical protein
MLPRPSGSCPGRCRARYRGGDDRADAQLTDLTAVDVVVIAAVGAEHVGASAGASALAADRRHGGLA